jgi:hypothetical protein
MTVEMESQSKAAQRIYNSRADKYNDSWHPSFANRFVLFLNPQTEWHILDLACEQDWSLLLQLDQLDLRAM